MPLESAVYIDTLDPTNPAGDDPVAQADDHLRQIKATLKTTFPNVKGAVTPSHSDLNTRLVPLPAGGGMFISMWSGIASTIPIGWLLCDGTNGTPDLRDRFIVGAGGEYAVAAKGGSKTATTAVAGAAALTTTVAGAHSHGGSTAGHALTLAEMPPHTHSMPEGDAGSGPNTGTGNSGGLHTRTTDSQGGGQAHTHGISADGNHSHAITVADHSHTVDTRSPYYALCYIAKS
jgi:hypothetical protein